MTSSSRCVPSILRGSSLIFRDSNPCCIASADVSTEGIESSLSPVPKLCKASEPHGLSELRALLMRPRTGWQQISLAPKHIKPRPGARLFNSSVEASKCTPPRVYYRQLYHTPQTPRLGPAHTEPVKEPVLNSPTGRKGSRSREFRLLSAISCPPMLCHLSFEACSNTRTSPFVIAFFLHSALSF
jgi:hypothetical protein